ncbi:MAG: DUF2145 domain-containing protein [Magnetococcales bacterium]|nr:DUF2145 domain-containing protein [Magnetococcales bacterium]
MPYPVRILAIWWIVLAGVAETDAASFSSGNSFGGGESHFKPEQIASFAKKVEKTLAGKGARVAILSRMGRPLSELPPGMHYTHVSFAVYSEITVHDGRKIPGYAIYNLYQNTDQPDSSDLVQDFPVDFFSAVEELESGIVIPSAELQKRLLEVIPSSTYRALHDPHYSAIANPYTLGRQNCTEFVLDVLFSAIYQTDDIHQIKTSERAYFVAQPVDVNPLKLMLGSLFSAEISLSDHSGQPVTATFETIRAFLLKYDVGAEALTVLP